MTQAPATAGQVMLDQTLTLQCVAGSLAAYNDFDNQPAHCRDVKPVPAGFTCLARLTGWDGFIRKDGTEERYGLIYQSTSSPDTYMVAFRGTDSDMDAWEDVWFGTERFQQYQGTGMPSDVMVSEGLFSVYATKGGSMATPMRDQIFTFLATANPAPRKVIVTGHSLGAAIANLFMLDMAASLPRVDTISTTIAAPRTGKDGWQAAYDTHYGLKNRTFRIANHYDWVPSLPPHTLFDFDHVGQRFLCAFYLYSPYYPAPLSWHSLLNYQTVLTHALPRSPQVWVGTFTDHVKTYFTDKMYSVAPDPSASDPEWAGDWRLLAQKYAIE